MKRDRRVTRMVLFEVGVFGLLAGCGIGPKENLVESTTQYNLVAEQAGNQMLLLNIVRASKRRPMYFTSFSKLTGSTTYKFGTGSISVPFGRIGSPSTTYSIAPMAEHSTSPLFDLQVLDTQEFTRGILMPVPMTTIAYYWAQGWPGEMLLHVFIRRIDIEYPCGKVTSRYNDPERECDFEAFQKEIRAWEWGVGLDPNTTRLAVVDANKVTAVNTLIEIQKAGIRLQWPEKDPNDKNRKVVLLQGRGEYVLGYRKKTCASKQRKEELQMVQVGPRDPTAPPPKKRTLRLYLRSPEAILYYLGEIMRVENRMKKRYVPMIGTDQAGKRLVPLFVARRAQDVNVATPWVSVDYEGTTYVIPGAPDFEDGGSADRSMHVLSLVSQLIGLQKKGELTPGTGVVRVVGQ